MDLIQSKNKIEFADSVKEKEMGQQIFSAGTQ